MHIMCPVLDRPTWALAAACDAFGACTFSLAAVVAFAVGALGAKKAFSDFCFIWTPGMQLASTGLHPSMAACAPVRSKALLAASQITVSV
jgi:hypothetical protein